MKKKIGKILSIAVVLTLCLGMLAGCSSTASEDDFAGVWEYDDYYMWFSFNEDGTFVCYYDDASDASGEYTVEDGTLSIVDDTLTFSFVDDVLTDSDGDTLFASELPDFTSAFVGVWEYEDYDIWVEIFDDGTYNWDYSDGTFDSGTYSMDVNTLVMDIGTTYSSDGIGGLIDSDGDSLFASELPEITDESEATVTVEETSASGVEDFYGYWVFDDVDSGVCINSDGTFDHYDGDENDYSGVYTYVDGTLVLENTGLMFTLGDDGGLVDNDGYLLHSASLPENTSTSDGSGVEDFYGYWEYTDSSIPNAVCIYNDGTFDWYNDGDYDYSGEYSYIDGALVLENTGLVYYFVDGTLTDNDGDTLYLAEDIYYDEDSVLSEFLGCWEYSDEDIFVVFYDDGTYYWFNADNGSEYTYTYTIDGDSLVMDDDGTTFYIDEEYDGWLYDSDGGELFSSELP